MDALKGILSLPFSRKVITGICTTLAVMLLVVLNRKLLLGLSDAEVIAIATAAVIQGAAVIWGIAKEDAAEKSAAHITVLPEAKPVNDDVGGSTSKIVGGGIAPILLMVLLPFFMGGCIEIHKKDAKTISSIETTIQHRKSDFGLFCDSLRNVSATATPAAREKIINGMDALQQGELDRLDSWLKYEQAKSEE
jgi:hypothetical protein